MKVQTERKYLTVELDAAGEAWTVTADRGDMDRIFMNLISNGIKYNCEGGRLRVTLRRQENPDRGHVLEVAVTDTGIGMSEEEMSGLFQEFYRVKNRDTSGISGTGLGLATVKRILDTYNGSIQVSSERGRGSTFTVRLPAA